MPKYKWLRETPWNKVGDEFEGDDSNYEVQQIPCFKSWSALISEGWIALVPEQPKRFTPKEYEAYWFMTESCTTVVIQTYLSSVFDGWRYESGNCFRTEAEAKHAAEKTRELWLSLHEEKAKTMTEETIELSKIYGEKSKCGCKQWPHCEHAPDVLKALWGVNISSPNVTKEEVSEVYMMSEINRPGAGID